MGWRSWGTHHPLCLQAGEKKYQLMGGCGQQRFLQENEGESGPRCLTGCGGCEFVFPAVVAFV